MPTYIKTGFWDKIIGNNPQQAKAPKGWLNLDYFVQTHGGGGGGSITVNGNTPVTNLTIGPVASETYSNGSLDITIDPYPGYRVYRAKISMEAIDWPGYGYLYNWYAVTDARKLENPAGGTGLTAPNEWRVPSDTDWDTLVTFAGGITVAGGKLKSTLTSTGYPFYGWLTAGQGTDDYNFNALGGGFRIDYGAYDGISYYGNYWTSSQFTPFNGIKYGLNFSDSSLGQGDTLKGVGLSVRLVREATAGELLLNDGDTSDTSSLDPYTGNDGKTYVTVKIDTQIWLAQNLRETQYNNLDSIFNASVLFGGDGSNSTWIAKGTAQEGAWAAYRYYESSVEYNPTTIRQFYNDVLENTLDVSPGQPTWFSNSDVNGPFYRLNKNRWNKTHIKITPGYDVSDFPTINERSLLIERAVEGDFDINFRPIKKDGTTGAITIEDLNNYNDLLGGTTSYVYVEILEYTPSYYNQAVGIGLSNL